MKGERERRDRGTREDEQQQQKIRLPPQTKKKTRFSTSTPPLDPLCSSLPFFVPRFLQRPLPSFSFYRIHRKISQREHMLKRNEKKKLHTKQQQKKQNRSPASPPPRSLPRTSRRRPSTAGTPPGPSPSRPWSRTPAPSASTTSSTGPATRGARGSWSGAPTGGTSKKSSTTSRPPTKSSTPLRWGKRVPLLEYPNNGYTT